MIQFSLVFKYEESLSSSKSYILSLGIQLTVNVFCTYRVVVRHTRRVLPKQILIVVCTYNGFD